MTDCVVEIDTAFTANEKATPMDEPARANRKVMRLIQEALALAPKAGLHLAIKITAATGAQP